MEIEAERALEMTQNRHHRVSQDDGLLIKWLAKSPSPLAHF